MMIEPLIHTDVTDFNKDTLKKLKPYFDNIFFATQKETWFHNLLTLATYNLGIAHCVQHDMGARLCLDIAFADRQFPNFYIRDYEQQIGCYSNVKGTDSLKLENNTVYGTKHWMSNLHQADYAIFLVPSNEIETYVLCELPASNLIIDSASPTLIGMEIARGNSLIIDNYHIPPGYILGHRSYFDTKSLFSSLNNSMDYAFITNYLGCIIGLFTDLKDYVAKNNINIDHELSRCALSISSLKMLWEDNLKTIHTTELTDTFWHRRNTHYTQSKNILLSLINLVLQVGDSRWLYANSNTNQRFRDALVFSTHMKPLYKNLKEKHFVKF